MIRKFLVINFLLVSFLSLGQERRLGIIDSLNVELSKRGVADTSKALLYSEISHELSHINPDSGIHFANLGLELSQQINLKVGIAKAYNSLGTNYETKSDFVKSVNYYLDANKLYKELGNRLREAITLGNVGNVYLKQKDWLKAIEYDSASIGIISSLKDERKLAAAIGNLGCVYNDYADHFLEKQDSISAIRYFDLALKMYSQALSMARKSGYDREVANNLGRIAGLYCEYTLLENHLEKAFKYQDSAIKMLQSIPGEENSLAINQVNLAEILLDIASDSSHQYSARSRIGDRSKLLSMAISSLQNSINYFKKINDYSSLYQSYQALASAYELNYDFKNAFIAYKLYDAAKQVVFNESREKEIAKLDHKHRLELKEKEKELEIIKQRTEKFAYIGGIVLLLAVIIVVIRKFKQSIQRNRQLAIEKKKHLERIKAQSTVLEEVSFTNSHELRGPLSTIMGLLELYNHDDPADPNNKELIDGIDETAKRLDKKITELVQKENLILRETEDEGTNS